MAIPRSCYVCFGAKIGTVYRCPLLCTQDTHSLVISQGFSTSCSKSLLLPSFVGSCSWEIRDFQSRTPGKVIIFHWFVFFISICFPSVSWVKPEHHIIHPNCFLQVSCFLFFTLFFRLDYQPLFGKMIKDRTRETAYLFLCVLNYAFYIRLLPSSDYDDGMNSSWFS